MSKYYDWEVQKPFHGQLSPSGYRQQYNLGKKLREEYIKDKKFLSDAYNFKEIKIRSTDEDRTISSAQSQMFGLYPQGETIPSGLQSKYLIPPYQQAQDDSSLGQFSLPNQISSIPIHVRHEMDDLELQPWNRCDEYVNLVEKFKQENKQTADTFNKNFTDIYTRLTTLLNQKINDYSNIGGVWGGVWDVFVADIFNGRKIPQELTQDEIDTIVFVDSFSWFFGDFGTEQGTKLLATPLLQHLVDNFDLKMNKTFTDLKFMAFSGHDSNLSMMLRAFNFTSYQCLLQKRFSTQQDNKGNCVYRPQFASSIIWELYQDDSDQKRYFVKIKYDGKYMKLCEKESEECEYNELKQRIMNYISKDYEGECKNQKAQVMQAFQTGNSNEIYVEDKKVGEYVAIGLLSFLCSVLIAYIVILHLRIKKIGTKKYQTSEQIVSGQTN